MKRNRCIYPYSPSSKDKDGTVFTHEIVGGLSLRDYVAIEFAKAMFSNPALPAACITQELVRTAAILQADKFVAMLGED